MNVSSSSTYTDASYSNGGISGLASGIDTESLVQSMLSGLQNKIDKQNQTKQQLLWKQEKYREVISDINDFQSKYFNLTSKSCIRLSSFYDTMETSCSSSAVKITAGANAADGEFKMQVAKLATASSVTSSKVGTGTVSTSTANASSFKFNRTVDIKIGDAEADPDSVITATVDLEGVTTADEVCQKINDAAGKTLVTAKYEEKTTYTDADGNTLKFDEKENKYYDSEGKEYTGSVTTKTEDVAVGLEFTSDSKFELSGTSSGMAILGLSGTVKSSVAKDEDGKEIEGKYEINSKAVNVQFGEVGKANGSVKMTLDGVTKTIAFAENESMNDLKEKVQSAFGNTVQFTENNGKWEISVDGVGRSFSMSANAETMEALGFSEDTTTVSNQIVRSDAIHKLGIGTADDKDTKYSFNINGKDIEYTSADSISSIMNKINSSDAGVKMSYDELSDKFTLKSTSTGEGYDISITGDDEGLFSKLGFTMSADSLDSSTVTKGENAVVNINGVTVERANNDFTYNGITISLKSTTGNYEKNADGSFVENADGTIKTVSGTSEEKAEVSTSRDVDKIVDNLKSFVEDYNKMIEKFNKWTHEEASYKSYAPLTDAQKKEMSEKEIELWEEKSQEGLLRNDNAISSFLTDMRSTMYTKAGARLSLSNIGIDSSSEWKDYGKLTIDEDKLRSALQTDSAGVKELFTGENGLATRLNKVCDKAASTSSAKPGALVSMAGVIGKGTENDNEIKDRLDSIAEKLEKLNELYEQRKERYWNQFNAMETAIANSNAQSDWLASQLGY